MVKFCFVPENTRCSKTDLALILTILLFFVFEILSIMYSKFVVTWGFTNSEEKNYAIGVSPPGPDAFGFNPPSQLHVVITASTIHK